MNNISIESKIVTRSFEYPMYVNVGMPSTQMLTVADTSSSRVDAATTTWTWMPAALSCYTLPTRGCKAL